MDNTDSEEEEERAALEENDFLGLINAEAIKALQEGEVSSDASSGSTSSDSADELSNVEEEVSRSSTPPLSFCPSNGSSALSPRSLEDPLNSGDDVIEQDIPDLFDTDNVIVCQYDKVGPLSAGEAGLPPPAEALISFLSQIHRSKNRWKFHLKDGVMCYGGRDYVFSKAVGEAEW